VSVPRSNTGESVSGERQSSVPASTSRRHLKRDLQVRVVGATYLGRGCGEGVFEHCCEGAFMTNKTWGVLDLCQGDVVGEGYTEIEGPGGGE
jgi:hypothetical protein